VQVAAQGARHWSPEHAMPLFSPSIFIDAISLSLFCHYAIFRRQRHYAAAIAIARRLRFFRYFRHFSFFSDMPRRHYADASSPIIFISLSISLPPYAIARRQH
jgi:hypothetical protein